MIPTTMLAVVYHPGNSVLVFNTEYPIRELEDNKILLKVAAVGVCHSDVNLLSGAVLDTRTYIMGHENCGVAIKLGAKVDANEIQKGRLYSILGVDSCMHRLNGGPVVFNVLGIGKDSGFAEYIIAPADALVQVPEGVPREAAAIASDAGITAYHAVQHAAKVKRGDKVLIFGIGGLGHLAVQYAKYFGATVYACDFKPAARKLALDLGATEAFDLIELTNKTAEGFVVDTTIDFVVNNQTFNLAMATLRPNNFNFPSSPTMVLAGATTDNLVFNTLDVIASGVQIHSTLYGPRSALVAALELFATGTVRAHVHSEPLENVNKVIDELRAFQITGRKVVIPRTTVF
ncbi:chaperonin 10-like protein [Mycena sp. CBHHK59/15]|nr:chaperonin 10-like protein [Mycena sp. CBHHK59/15]